MKHPAKFSAPILDVIKNQLDRQGFQGWILDPFAGVGGVHELQGPGRYTVGVELEPEWAKAGGCQVGSALALPFSDGAIDAIVTSPCYGNRMADRDMRESVAGTYAKSLGRVASEDSACHLQWGPQYRRFHTTAWLEAARVLCEDGLFVLNVSDHIRDRARQAVTAYHIDVLCSPRLGFVIEDLVPVRTRRLKNGANASARVDAEMVITLRKA